MLYSKIIVLSCDRESHKTSGLIKVDFFNLTASGKHINQRDENFISKICLLVTHAQSIAESCNMQVIISEVDIFET
jgi:hypothetical protein